MRYREVKVKQEHECQWIALIRLDPEHCWGNVLYIVSIIRFYDNTNFPADGLGVRDGLNHRSLLVENEYVIIIYISRFCRKGIPDRRPRIMQ